MTINYELMSSNRIQKAPFVFFLALAFAPAAAQDDLNVISGRSQWLHYTDAGNALYHHLAKEAYQHLDERRKKIASYNSVADWTERQQWIKKVLHTMVGPFPEKTPLNAKVLRTIEKEGYRIEHIVFESQPEFYVTSSLFIPKSLRKKERAPVVIYCSGHAEEGYRSEVYQHVILNLVKKGFIVFAYDPVGQGERLEYLDPGKAKSSVGGPTSEHSYPGTQAFISGSSQARHMIWDGIRAVDYILTRKEVDPSRIGITGRSGGGTQSAYIAAFDERILAVAPECYITSFTRLLQSIGPQDAEQNFFRGIKHGFDHGDLLIVRAPKPALMITTTRDIFSIQGARETASEVARVYQALGKESNFAMVEDDAPHASTVTNREAMYAFFQKHLGNPGNAGDEKVALPADEELRVTATGQVSTSLGGQTVFTINRKETKHLIESLYPAGSQKTSSVINRAKELSGYRTPETNASANFTGRIQRNGYAVEKYFVKGEGNYVIPFLLLVPARATGKTILYLHPAGKAAEAAPGGEMEWFVKNGFSVLAPDLAGTGEMGAGDFEGDAFIGGVSHNIWYTSVLIGRSIVGLQAGDIARVLASLESLQTAEIYGFARKEMSSALLHAAAFIPAIKKIALVEPLVSYGSLATSRYYHSPFVYGAVPGCLTAYDLPLLAAGLAPRKLLMVDALQGSGEKVSSENISEFNIIRDAYAKSNNSGRLQIVPDVSAGKLKDYLLEWLAE